MAKISSKDVSVVIQGGIHQEHTPKLIESIRKYLPQSTIILSTWETKKFDCFLDYDVLVTSKLPDAAVMDSYGNQYNINRMLRSTKEGLKRVKTKYVLKLRSDCILKSNQILLDYASKYEKRVEHCAIASKKIVISSLYTIEKESQYNQTHPTPFHISDWFAFGLTTDVTELFQIEEVNIKEFATYMDTHETKYTYGIPWLKTRKWRFPPEQYLGYCYAKKKLSLEMEHCLDYDHMDMKLSNQFLLSNFVSLDSKESGIYLQKAPYDTFCKDMNKIPVHVKEGILTTQRYEQRYHQMFFDAKETPESFQDEVAYKTIEYPIYSKQKSKVYENAIITPTYRGHFGFIEKYLESYSQYVTDKEKVCIYFVIDAKEFEEFTQIIKPYVKEITMEVVIFEDVLKAFHISRDSEELLNRYGRFSFQTLKKMLTMKYVECKHALMLDSESMWVNRVNMSEKFREFFEHPFICYSTLKEKYVNDFVLAVNDNINKVLQINENKWYLENFVWYYDKVILDDLFEELGSFYQAVEKIYRYELNRKERPGIFEINLYQAFINKHNAKYGYQVRSVDELIEEAGIDRETKYKYHVRYYNKFQGSNGFLEMAMILINDSDYEAFANLFKQNKFGIIRCEDSRTNYAVQKKFMQIVKPYILAASQNHRFGINQIQKKEMKTNKKYRWNQLKELNLKAKTRESMKSLYYKISPQYRQLWAIREKLDAITFTTNMIDQKVEDTKNHVCTIKENQFKANAFSCYKRLEEQVREYSKNNKHVVLLSPFIFNGIKCCQNYKQVPLRGRERLVLIFLEEKESRVAASYFKKKNVNYVILNVC